jgi:hypothetical protein
MEPTPSEIVHGAVDALLLAVAKSAEDLNAFHRAVTHARSESVSPFPRETVVVAERIIDGLRRVEQDLGAMLVDLGLSSGEPRD